MALATNDLSPYVSVILAKLRSGARRSEILKEILNDVRDILDLGSSPDDRRQRLQRRGPEKDGDLWVAFLRYVERRTPGWLSGRLNEPRDTLNHLVLVCRRDRHVAIFVSDAAVKPSLLARLDGQSLKGLSGLAPIPEGIMNAAFVDGPARTLWLSGIHRRTPVKADSKILAGLSLEDALNPLGDQTYYFTASRCYVELPSLPEAKSRTTVGASPRKSRVWAGPSLGWEDYRDRVHALLGQLKKVESADRSQTAPLPVLATPVSEVSALEKPYDVSVVAPELLADTPDLPREMLERAERWAYRASFEVTEILPDGRSFRAAVAMDGEQIGAAQFDIAVDASGRADVTPSAITAQTTDDELMREAIAVCRSPRWLKIRYESGHTLSDGVFYSVRFRDVRFTDWRFVNLRDFDVTKEKPGTGSAFVVDDIGVAGEKSLFTWVQRNWFDLDNPGTAQRGWLASDDGAGEIADFIHYDFERPESPLLTLVHVKASGSASSARQISTSDYEVVVGQAVKNLRSLDRSNLATRLKAGSGKTVASAVWLNGSKKPDRSGMIARLKADGEDFARRVVVVQPRVTQSEYDRVRQDQRDRKETSRVARMRQLDALLVGARSDCSALGADFFVIGDDA